jgi:hypothetical protein
VKWFAAFVLVMVLSLIQGLFAGLGLHLIDWVMPWFEFSFGECVGLGLGTAVFVNAVRPVSGSS